MDKQDIFDRVWEWFITKENPPGLDDNHLDCVYLTEDGTRCAIGVLLPRDEEANAWAMEFLGGVESLLNEEEHYGLDSPPSILKWVSQYKPLESFLRELQATHDSVADEIIRNNENFHDEFYVRMKELAEKFNLEVPA